MTRRPRSDDKRLIETSRRFGDFLCLWRLCPKAACARTRACKGNVRECFPRHFPLLPQGVQEWLAGLGEAQRRGLAWDEAMEILEAEGCGEALRKWHAAVEQSLAKPEVTRH